MRSGCSKQNTHSPYDTVSTHRYSLAAAAAVAAGSRSTNIIAYDHTSTPLNRRPADRPVSSASTVPTARRDAAVLGVGTRPRMRSADRTWEDDQAGWAAAQAAIVDSLATSTPESRPPPLNPRRLVERNDTETAARLRLVAAAAGRSGSVRAAVGGRGGGGRGRGGGAGHSGRGAGGGPCGGRAAATGRWVRPLVRAERAVGGRALVLGSH